jgi:Mg-chelatase subunit ChlD
MFLCSPEISLNQHKSFNAVVTLTSVNRTTASSMDVERTEQSRAPLDIVCVLDTSGSMSGDNKLVNLKYAVDYIRGELNVSDRYGVITFEQR